MNINEACNINKDTPHKEKYEKIVNFLGYENVLKYLPFNEEQIRKAYYGKNDEHLNSLSIRKWNNATGVIVQKDNNYNSKTVISGFGLSGLLIHKGINVFSLSECVCILKRAAVMRLEKEKLEEMDRDEETIEL